jgi:hypothetical protein
MASRPEPVRRRVHSKAAVHEVLADRFKSFRTGDRPRIYRRQSRGSHQSRRRRHVLNYQGCDLWEFRDGYVLNKDIYWKIVPD